MTTTKTRKSSKTTKTAKPSKQVKDKSTGPEHRPLFAGIVSATKVFHREMPEFKNCKATCWLIVNEVNQTYTFANSYQGPTPKSSYDPAVYTYTLSPKAQKVLDKKMDLFTEMEDREEWPAWITPALRKTRKSSK